MNKVVARFVDGRVVKGETYDFLPTRESFHVIKEGTPPGGLPLEIQTQDLKALFFIKDFAGKPDYSEQKEFNPARSYMGRRIRIEFRDGEVLVGTTQGYQPGRAGFFIEPADADSNNERCYIISAAANDIRFI